MSISVYSGREEYEKLLAVKSMPYFYQPWWLDAAVAGNWQVRTVWSADKPLGFVIFVIKRHRWGTLLRKPVLTPHAGFQLFLEGLSPQKRLSTATAVLRAIDSSLPNHVHARFTCAPGFVDGVNLQWLGYKQQVKYYNRIDLTKDLNILSDNLSKSTRKQVKKGARWLEIRNDLDVESTYEFIRSAIYRRNGRFQISLAKYRYMMETLQSHARVLGLGVFNEYQYCLGRTLVVVDNDWAYSIGLGASRGGISDIAGKLLKWESIKMAKSLGCNYYHFGGSMIPGVHKFNTGFGAEAVPYYEFTKYKNRLWEALALFRKP